MIVFDFSDFNFFKLKGYTTYFEQELNKMKEEMGDKFKQEELVFYSQSILDKWIQIPKEIRAEYTVGSGALKPDPICFKFNPACNFGVLTEQMDNLIYNYINSNKENLVSKSRFKSNEALETNRKKLVSKSRFTKTINTHYLRSHCQPGEAVGLLSAQSIASIIYLIILSHLLIS